MSHLLDPDYMIFYDPKQKMWLAFDIDGIYLTRGVTMEAAKTNAEFLRKAINEKRGSNSSGGEQDQTV